MKDSLTKLLLEYQDVAQQIIDAWQDVGGCDEYKFRDNCSELCPFRYPKNAKYNDFGCHKATLHELSHRVDEVCNGTNTDQVV